MKTVYYLLFGLCLATAACKPDEPEMPKPEESKDEIINGICGENLTWSYNKTKAILTISGTGEMKDYDYIDVPWEAYKKEFQTVIIEDGVTSIGNYAFSNCSALAEMTVLATVPPTITANTFSNINPQVKVSIPEGSRDAYMADENWKWLLDLSAGELSGICGDNLTWTFTTADSTLTISGTGDMYDYSDQPWYNFKQSIKNISIQDGVTSIGNYAFYYCSALAQVTIPESVTSIGNYAFSSCDALTQITIPNSVESIGSAAFYYCKVLTEVTIGSSVTSIGNSAFSMCFALTAINVANGNIAYCSIDGILFNIDKTLLVKYPANKPETAYTIPNTVISIGNSAFDRCKTLTKVTIGNNVTKIGNWAFNYCEELTQVTIGNSVTSIGNSAFFQCSALTQIIIPNSVTNIGGWAFKYCSALTEITVLATVPPTVGTDTFYWVGNDIPVYVPAESLETYKAAEVWKEFTNLQAIP